MNDEVARSSGGVSIRAECVAEVDAIADLNRAVFPTSVEARIVEELRTAAQPFISLVAEYEGAIVGHIAFSPVTLTPESKAQVLGLGPMCVRADRQRQGIGGLLVTDGLERCRSLGATAVVVLGHPDYYPRFGFRPASGRRVACVYDVPDPVFMLLELRPNAMGDGPYIARYHQAFDAAI